MEYVHEASWRIQIKDDLDYNGTEFLTILNEFAEV
jgi:hypothetical protein